MSKRANKAARGKDKYYHLAKEQGYRARSAFKLIQLNKKFDFLSKSKVLLDLCAAPGGWLQVAAKYMPTESTIIGVDLMPIRPIRGVVCHQMDITTQECRSQLRHDLRGMKADVILHDGAPNVGSNWLKDAFGQSELVLHSLKLATEFLRPKGTFVTKVFRSQDYNSLLWVFHQLFGKVEATKPHSSRTASAEIFVVCRDYKAPAKIDPKLLDIKYVFKDVADSAGTGVGVAGGGSSSGYDLFHKKKSRKERQRDGYDETLGPLLSRRIPVMDFIRAEDPVHVLAMASSFDFDEEAQNLGLTRPDVTPDEIRACSEDLKIIGRGDFKALLKWRLRVRHRHKHILETPHGADSDDGFSDGTDDGEDGSESDDSQDQLRTELSHVAAAELARRRREKKRSAKARALALKRQRLGLNLRSVDMLDDDINFDFDSVRRFASKLGEKEGAAFLDSITNVRLDDSPVVPMDILEAEGDVHIDPEEARKAAEEEDEADALEQVLKDDSGGTILSRLRGLETEARLEDMEENFEAEYARYLANQEKAEAISRQEAETGKVSHGIKLMRRERLHRQALLTEAVLNKRLDDEHARYITLLSGARSALSTSDVANALTGEKRHRSDMEDEGLLSDIPSESEDAPGDANVGGEIRRVADTDIPTDAKIGSASRWFSQPQFADAVADAQTGDLGLSLGLDTKQGGDADGDDGFISLDTDSEEEEFVRTQTRREMKNRAASLAAKKSAPSLADGLRGTIEVDSDGEEYPNWLSGVPKSEREKRKDRLRKQREKEDRQRARMESKEASATAFQIVEQDKGGHEDANTEFASMLQAEGVSTDDLPQFAQESISDIGSSGDRERHAELLRQGMGNLLNEDADDVDGQFEVVAQDAYMVTDSGSDDDSDDSDDDYDTDASEESHDPRLDDYDSDTHAEMLALGRQLKRATSRKALVDASYNRYAFDEDDSVLPPWFVSDENKNFRPQLPITREEVESIKARFRDIAARPIHKVAEARARKKRRMETQLAKARQQATGILEQEELGPRSKAKMIASLYRKAEATQKGRNVVVAPANTRTANQARRKGAKVIHVDARMKKDKAAAKRREKRGKRRKGGKR